jgi:tetratricopeptide (TPR) repeat protein
LEKDRNRRYDSASSIVADVQRYLNDEPVLACPPSAGYRLRKFARRNKAVLVTVSVAALSAFLVIGVIAGSLGWMARDRSVRQARLNLEVAYALDEAEKAFGQALALTDAPYQWEAVLVAAASALKRADGLAAQEEAGLEPDLHARLEALRVRLDADEHDRVFVSRCDEIRQDALSQSNLEIVFPACKQAFQRHYAIVVGETSLEKVLNFLKHKPLPVRQLLVAALDGSLAFVPKDEPQAREWLAAVLHAIDSSEPWRRQARAAMEARDWQTLSKLLEEPEASWRQAPTVLLGLAARYQWDGSTAVDFWRYIRQAYPGDFWANYALATMFHHHQRRWEEAIRYYTAASSLRPRNPMCYLELGNALYGKGDLDEAIASYRQAIAIASRYAGNEQLVTNAHSQLVLAFGRKGCLDEAISELRQSIHFRNAACCHHALGITLERNGFRDQAIACYRKTIALDPKFGKAHYNLSSALLDEQEYLDEAIASFRNAIACYREAIRLNPRDGFSHSNLAWILVMSAKAELRDPAESVRLAQKAVELVPNEF